ncbi:cysteine desulfurase, mitochondrial [Tachysurus ichikawai]
MISQTVVKALSVSVRGISSSLRMNSTQTSFSASHKHREGIKRRELEKNEMRPLYMDFQATTPMGSI